MTTWHARMIAADKEHDGAPLLRGEFELDEGHGDVESATLFLSALGVVEAWVNGQRASQDLLTPGWSSYEWRVRYSELDVTALISTTTVIGLALGNGWYRGPAGLVGRFEVLRRGAGRICRVARSVRGRTPANHRDGQLLDRWAFSHNSQ